MKQLPLEIVAEAPRTFENFMPGANALAVDHLATLAAGAPPVYLWGPPGSGKTHLLQATAARALARGGRVASFGSAFAAPWSESDAWSLVLLDDVERYDESQQRAAFGLFVEAATQGWPIVAAGAAPPVDLPLREDLRTRLGWGHVFALQPLGEAGARAALRREADRRGVFLSDDVMDYLLTRFARDLKNLMTQLDRLDAYALSHQRAITVPLLRRMSDEDGKA
ncbi:MAG TPA: DnaA regulatory inactivator Hda [Caldimonas sp.]|nr:DnaA regulatory inactivator Hda [Caldimonas sp.]